MIATAISRLASGPTQNDQSALPQRCTGERALQVFCTGVFQRWIRFAGGIGVAREQHIAAQRNRGDPPAGAAFIDPVPQLFAHADRKGHCAHAKSAAHPVMAQLMQHDQRPKQQQKRADIHQKGDSIKSGKLQQLTGTVPRLGIDGDHIAKRRRGRRSIAPQ